MESLDITKLKRNSEKLKSKINVLPNLTMCKDDMYVIFPNKYVEKSLAFLDRTVRVIGLLAIVDKQGYYCVVNAPIFIEFSPFSIEDIMVGDTVYKQLLFKKDTVLIPDNNHLVTDSHMYDIFDLFFIQGKIPWYLSYDDVGDLLIRAKEYAASKLGDDPTTIEILTSIIGRYSDNKQIYYREIIDKPNMKNKLSFIGLNDIIYSFNNTGAKLIGGYFGKGLFNSMVDPETSTSKTSEILRS